MYRSVRGPENEIAKAIHSPWFRIGTKVQNLGASARPCAFAYSQLLERKIGKTFGRNGTSLPLDTKPTIATKNTFLSAEEQALVSELVEICERLRKRHARILLVMIPSQPAINLPGQDIPVALSRLASVPLWDLTIGLPPGAVKLTDVAHMDPASAAATLTTLLRELVGPGFAEKH